VTEFTQTPAELNLTATHNDDFDFNLDFNIDLTGYTFSAKVVTVSTKVLVPMTVTQTDLGLGKIALGIDTLALAALETSNRHHWYLEWTVGGKPRKILAGLFKIVDYP